MDITLNVESKLVDGVVSLPASKSISNRALIINALADSQLPIENLANCDDTRTMLNALNSSDNRFDVGHAGTAMRFLTAFLARIVGRWELTGSERMKQRPINILADALNRLGARIEYLEQQGYPPLRIDGTYLLGGEIEIPASVSSQYISALMMIAPYMAKGLTIKLTGKIVSGTYIDMTVRLMKIFGAQVSREGAVIRITPCPYTPVAYRVESDWSAASYFYEILAIADGGVIQLTGLDKDSMQGDARQMEVWQQLGVTTTFYANDVILRKSAPKTSCLVHDFVEMPDLVQSFAVACCMKEIPFRFDGVETLRIKETDRIQALTLELRKLGYELRSQGDNTLIWDGTRCIPEQKIRIQTYHDHRMAMAFAPAVFKQNGLVIANQEVVSKSFPEYWNELSRLGVILSS